MGIIQPTACGGAWGLTVVVREEGVMQRAVALSGGFTDRLG